MRSSTAGTRFSAARSGPVWQPTQMRCSPPRRPEPAVLLAQYDALRIQQRKPNGLVARHLHEKRAILFHRRRSHCNRVCPLRLASPAAPALAHLSERRRAKGAHPAPADSHSPMDAIRKDADSAVCAARPARARRGSHRLSPSTVSSAASPGFQSCDREMLVTGGPRAQQPCARSRLRNRARILGVRRNHMLFMCQRRRKPRQRVSVGEHHIAQMQVASAPARPAVIAAIRLHTRAVGIDQVQLRRRPRPQREARFKQNAPVLQDICGKRIRLRISQREQPRTRCRV